MTSLNVGDSIQFTTPDVTITRNGDTLELSNIPSTPNSIATKQYVDNALSTSGYVAVHHTAKALLPSGTIGTGTSGHLVLTTALPTTYSYGVWAYLPTIATTPAITAGFYYMEATNTTTLTIYDTDTDDKQPYDFTVGAAYTGATTEITMYTDPLAANSLGKNGRIIGETCILHNASTNAKTYRWKYGGTTTNVTSQTGATVLLYTGYTTIFNQNNTARQMSNRLFATGVCGNAPLRSTIDTTLNQNLVLTMQKANALEYLIVEGYCVEVDYIA